MYGLIQGTIYLMELLWEVPYVRVLAQCPELSTEGMMIKYLLLLAWFQLQILDLDPQSCLKPFGYFMM